MSLLRALSLAASLQESVLQEHYNTQPEDTDDVEISIVVVTHNSAKQLLRCLESVRLADIHARHEVFVVDNASSDGSAQLVRSRFPDVKLLANSYNVGMASAVNQAWQRASGRFLCVMNPDVTVANGAFDTLRRYLVDHPEVGLVAPRLLNPDGSLQYSCRRHYTLSTYAFRRTPLGRLFPDHPIVRRHLMTDWDHAEIRDVDWVLGAAMMVRREAAGSEVLDGRFFLYFEDVDLCLRLKQEGWRVVYHPEAVMRHHHRRASAEGFINRYKYYHLSSWIRFHLKHWLAKRNGNGELTA